MMFDLIHTMRIIQLLKICEYYLGIWLTFYGRHKISKKKSHALYLEEFFKLIKLFLKIKRHDLFDYNISLN